MVIIMKVYHGTSLKNWKKIKKTGLLPRAATNQSNWKHSIESNSDTIYLTDAYAMHFSLACVKENEDDKFDDAVIIEIETDNLPGYLVPDEDALEQLSRRSRDGLPDNWDINKRTQHYKRLVRDFAGSGLDHTWSLDVLGTCGHIGIISPKHFTRVAIIDIQKEAKLTWMYMNCQISIGNYKFLGAHYRKVSKAIFGETYQPKDKDIILPGYDVPEMGSGIQIINLNKENNETE